MKVAAFWAIGTLAAGAIGGLLYWVHGLSRKEIEEERARDKPVKPPSQVSRDSGKVLVVLSKEARENIGLNLSSPAQATLVPEVAAYGKLEEDPSQSFVVRAPLGGFLRTSETRGWPGIGESLRPGEKFGKIQLRFSPAERVDLETRWAKARADRSLADAALEAARKALQRLQGLGDKIVPQRDLQAAEARVRAEEANRKGADETASAIQMALSGGPGGLDLSSESPGEIVELLARPGEAVESGQAILRLERFETLLARVVLAPGESFDPEAKTARVVAVGRESLPMAGERVALGPLDAASVGTVFLFRVLTLRSDLRPGMAVTAYVAVGNIPEKGVVIPRAAVVRFAGAAWAYVAIGEDKFTRRRVETRHPVESGWFVSSGFSSSDKVVTAGAQMILSEERKSDIQVLGD